MISVEAPLDMVPMFVRAGAVIPSGPSMNYVGEKPVDPITFNIYPDDSGKASGSFYEDDGLSPAYTTGAFRRTNFSVSRVGKRLVVSIGPADGTYNSGPRKFNFAVKQFRSKIVTVVDTGKAQQVEVR